MLRIVVPSYRMGSCYAGNFAQYFVYFYTWIVTAATALPIDENSENTSRTMNKYRLPDNVVPINYDIKLIPHNEEGTFDGESNIVVQIRRPTNSLHLHALQLTIDEAATKLVGTDGNNYVPTAYNNDDETQILAIEFETNLPPGEYNLHLRFAGILDDDAGFYRKDVYNEGKEQWLVAVQCGPTTARRVFPCWDEPALKATFKISVKHERNYTVLSNMPIQEQTNEGSDTVWTHFEKTPIMSTFHVAFVMVTNDFIRIPNEDGTINVWCESSQSSDVKYLQETAVKIGQLLAEYTDNAVKIPKIDIVVMPDNISTDMENWGLILCDKLYNENENIITKHMITQGIVIDMIHQWLTNTVDPSWWSCALLNQGLVLFFMDYIVTNQLFDDLRKTELFVIDTHQKALRNDTANNIEPIVLDVNTPEEIYEFLGTSRSSKVPPILRMLYHILTGDVFRKGIIKYLKAHQFGSATPDDLWSAFQEALDESDVPHKGYTVKEVMDTWIKQKHYPVVYVTRNYENGDVILTQKHFRGRQNETGDDQKWWIPISFATRSNPDFSNTLPTHWLKPQDENLIIKGIDLDDWIIVNLQETGYYRVQYDFSCWYKIADYLNSNDYKKIHVLNRAQILDDFYHLMVHPSDLVKFKELANYLHRETDLIAWAPIFEFVKNTEDFNDFPDIHSLKVHLVKLMSVLVKHVGVDEDPAEDEFTKFTRVLILQAACIFGNIECAKMIAKKIEEIHPHFEILPPNTQLWIYTGMMDPDSMICKMDECIDDLDRTVLQKRWFERPDVFIALLDAFISDDTLTNGEYNTIYDTIVQKHAENDTVLDYLLANIKKTSSRGCTTRQILEKIVKNVHSATRLKKISTFVKENFDKGTFEWTKTVIDKRKAEL